MKLFKTVFLLIPGVAAFFCGPSSAGLVSLRFNGVLGQSQAIDANAIPFLGDTGLVKDKAGIVWTTNGESLFAFSLNGGELKLAKTVQIPQSINMSGGLQYDGARIYFSSWDGAVYSFDPEQSQIKPNRFCSLPDGWRCFTAAPATLSNGFAHNDRLIFYDSKANTIRGVTDAGIDSGVVLTLPPLTPGSPYYAAIGVEPVTGDLLVAGYYPDINVHRFSASGAEVTSGGWPRAVSASGIVDINGAAWALGSGGGAESLYTPLDPDTTKSVEPAWTMYSSGMVSDSSGGYWIASSQGLVHFDKRGNSLDDRIGGLPDVSLPAMDDAGDVVAAVENGGRFVRMLLDDEPNSAFRSNGNEPWRVGGGWSGKATGIAVDGSTFLVLDGKANQIWRFSPNEADKGLNDTWSKVTGPPGTHDLRAIALSDSTAWILDGDRILEGSSYDLTNCKQITLPGVANIADVSYLATDGASSLFVSENQSITSFERNSDGSYTANWKSTEPFVKVAGLAWTFAGLAVSDSGHSTITVLSAKTGAALTSLNASDIPGEMTPAEIAGSGDWLVAVDSKNNRLIRVHVKSSE